MSSRNQSNYLHFTPGNNLWKKIPRLLIFSFERAAVLAVVFMVWYLCATYLFSYDIRPSKILFTLVMVALGIFLILPAPSMPYRLMWSEVLVRPIIGLSKNGLGSSVKIVPLEQEER